MSFTREEEQRAVDRWRSRHQAELRARRAASSSSSSAAAPSSSSPWLDQLDPQEENEALAREMTALRLDEQRMTEATFPNSVWNNLRRVIESTSSDPVNKRDESSAAASSSSSSSSSSSPNERLLHTLEELLQTSLRSAREAQLQASKAMSEVVQAYNFAKEISDRYGLFTDLPPGYGFDDALPGYTNGQIDLKQKERELDAALKKLKKKAIKNTLNE